MDGSVGKFRGVVAAVAWASTMLASSLGVILWEELADVVPWLPWVNAIGLTTVFITTLAISVHTLSQQ